MATPTPRPPSSLSRFPRERVQGNPPRVLGSRDELEDLPSSPTNAPRRFDADAPFGVVARDLHALVEPRIDGEASATLRALGGFPGLADALKVDPRFGLDPDDAADLAARVSRFGANTIPSRPTRTFLDMLADALEDDTLRVLLAAGALSLALEFALETGVDARPEVAGSNLGWVEGAAILGAVAVVAIVTAVNEHQKQTQFERLTAAAEADASAIALRGGRSRTIPVADVVVGDVIRLEAGDVVPADAIVFASKSASVCVDESHLTGESDDVRKDPRTFPPLLSGSRVLQGECDALVACVGSESQMGIITTLVRRIEARGVEGADQGADRGADQGVRLSSDAARRASRSGAPSRSERRSKSDSKPSPRISVASGCSRARRARCSCPPVSPSASCSGEVFSWRARRRRRGIGPISGNTFASSSSARRSSWWRCPRVYPSL